MSNLPTREEIAVLIEFVSNEQTDRLAAMLQYDALSKMQNEYLAAARSAVEIARRLPALVAEIERVKEERDEWRDLYSRDLDPPVCRLQFPDGSVPGNAREAAEGWQAEYDKVSDDRSRLRADIARLTKERDDARAIIDGQNRGAAEQIAGLVKERDGARACHAKWMGLQSGTADVVRQVEKERDQSDNALRRIGMSLGSSDEWTDQATMIADVSERVARLSRENAAMRTTLGRIHRETGATFHGSAADRAIGLVHTLAGAQLDAPSEKMAEEAPPLTVDYTNWRGERRIRNIIPLRTFHGSNEWHKEPQWLLEAVDPEDGKTKTFSFSGIHGFGDPAEEAECKFDEWIRELDEDVIQGEYGYERGEFTVFPDHWRSAFDEGLSPKQAFDRSLKAYDDARKERDRDAKANYELIKASDRATLAEHALAAARQTIAEAVERLRCIVESDTIKSACGWYPEIQAARAFVEAHGKKEVGNADDE